MATITIDTLKAANVLKEHGYTKQQAEGLLTVFKDIDLNEVASKSDVHDVKDDIANLRSEMYKVITAQTLVIITAVVGLLQLL